MLVASSTPEYVGRSRAPSGSSGPFVEREAERAERFIPPGAKVRSEMDATFEGGAIGTLESTRFAAGPLELARRLRSTRA